MMPAGTDRYFLLLLSVLFSSGKLASWILLVNGVDLDKVPSSYLYMSEWIQFINKQPIGINS